MGKHAARGAVFVDDSGRRAVVTTFGIRAVIAALIVGTGAVVVSLLGGVPLPGLTSPLSVPTAVAPRGSAAPVAALGPATTRTAGPATSTTPTPTGPSLVLAQRAAGARPPGGSASASAAAPSVASRPPTKGAPSSTPSRSTSPSGTAGAPTPSSTPTPSASRSHGSPARTTPARRPTTSHAPHTTPPARR